MTGPTPAKVQILSLKKDLTINISNSENDDITPKIALKESQIKSFKIDAINVGQKPSIGSTDPIQSTSEQPAAITSTSEPGSSSDTRAMIMSFGIVISIILGLANIMMNLRGRKADQELSSIRSHSFEEYITPNCIKPILDLLRKIEKKHIYKQRTFDKIHSDVLVLIRRQTLLEILPKGTEFYSSMLLTLDDLEDNLIHLIEERLDRYSIVPPNSYDKIGDLDEQLDLSVDTQVKLLKLVTKYHLDPLNFKPLKSLS
jgi:hypothetical protein